MSTVTDIRNWLSLLAWTPLKTYLRLTLGRLLKLVGHEELAVWLALKSHVRFFCHVCFLESAALGGFGSLLNLLWIIRPIIDWWTDTWQAFLGLRYCQSHSWKVQLLSANGGLLLLDSYLRRKACAHLARDLLQVHYRERYCCPSFVEVLIWFLCRLLLRRQESFFLKEFVVFNSRVDLFVWLVIGWLQ